MAFTLLDSFEDTAQTIAANDEVYQSANSLLAVDGTALTTGSGVQSAFYGEVVGSNVGISLGGSNQLTLGSMGGITGLTGNAITLSAVSSYLTLGGTVAGSDDALFSSFGGHTVFNSGTITADNTTIDFRLGGNTITNTGNLVSTSNGAVFIDSGADTTKNIFLNTGTITGAVDGVELNGVDSVFTNDGSILAGAEAVKMYGANAQFTNNGSLSAEGFGLEIDNFDGGIIQNNGTVNSGNDGINAFGGANVTVSNTGRLHTGDVGMYLQSVSDSVVQNSGIINALRTGVQINVGAESIFTNTGSVDAVLYGLFITNSNDITVKNMGQISSAGIGVLAGGNDISIDNSGEITAISDGIRISIGSSDNAKVTNSGHISSSSGTGIYVGSDGASIVNSGTIESRSGIAIDVETSENLNGTSVLNTGLIVGNDSSGGFAVQMDANFGDVLRNTGTIDGGAELRGGDDLMVNSGEVFGTVTLGDGVDVYRGKRDGYVSLLVDGGDGNDTMVGASQDDKFFGGDDDDILRGAQGDDELNGENGEDKLFGGDGDDTLNGGGQKDTLVGGQGDDYLLGGLGADNLSGGHGDDTLNAGNGNDLIDGGRGDDKLVGGGGADVFVFGRKAGYDVITDFTNGQDKINLTAFELTGVSDLQSTFDVNQSFNGVQIDMGDGDAILIQGFTLAQLDNADFIF